MLPEKISETHWHFYISTACQHDQRAECRHTCKFCEAPCRCECHGDPNRTRLTVEEHRRLHVALHRAVDLLAADWLGHQDYRVSKDAIVPLKLLSSTTIMELMEWSHAQTKDPTPLPGFEHDDDAKGDSYRNDAFPERACDHCGKLYRGPAVYCSFDCAISDARLRCKP